MLGVMPQRRRAFCHPPFEWPSKEGRNAAIPLLVDEGINGAWKLGLFRVKSLKAQRAAGTAPTLRERFKIHRRLLRSGNKGFVLWGKGLVTVKRTRSFTKLKRIVLNKNNKKAKEGNSPAKAPKRSKKSHVVASSGTGKTSGRHAGAGLATSSSSTGTCGQNAVAIDASHIQERQHPVFTSFTTEELLSATAGPYVGRPHPSSFLPSHAKLMDFHISDMGRDWGLCEGNQNNWCPVPHRFPAQHEYKDCHVCRKSASLWCRRCGHWNCFQHLELCGCKKRATQWLPLHVMRRRSDPFFSALGNREAEEWIPFTPQSHLFIHDMTEAWKQEAANIDWITNFLTPVGKVIDWMSCEPERMEWLNSRVRLLQNPRADLSLRAEAARMHVLTPPEEAARMQARRT